MRKSQVLEHVCSKPGAFLLSGVVVCFSCIAPSSVRAHEVFHVKKLHVEKGHKEVEIQGAHFSGHPEEEEGHDDEHHHGIRHAHEAALLYGMTDWWQTGLALGLEKPLEGKFDLASIEFENIFVLLPEKSGFGFGLMANFGRSFEEHTNSIELGTVSSLNFHNWDATLNSSFGRNLSGDETDWGYDYAAQVRFNLDDQWKFGIEAYGKIENIKNAGSFDAQTHRMGPVLYWSSASEHEEEGHQGHDGEKEEHEEMHIHTELGLLFGVSDEANDVTIKWGMGVSF